MREAAEMIIFKSQIRSAMSNKIPWIILVSTMDDLCTSLEKAKSVNHILLSELKTYKNSQFNEIKENSTEYFLDEEIKVNQELIVEDEDPLEQSETFDAEMNEEYSDIQEQLKEELEDFDEFDEQSSNEHEVKQELIVDGLDAKSIQLAINEEHSYFKKEIEVKEELVIESPENAQPSENINLAYLDDDEGNFDSDNMEEEDYHEIDYNLEFKDPEYKDPRWKMSCNICGKKLKTKFSVQVHIRRFHHQNSVVEKDGLFRIKCEKCDKLLSEHSIIKHMKAVHEGIRDHKCHKCDKTFRYPKSLRDHIKTVHDGIKDKFFCYLCGKYYTREERLRAHVKKTHKMDKFFKCQHCEDAFISNKELVKHMKSNHEYNKNFTCNQWGHSEFCGHSLSTQLTLESQVPKVKQKDNPWACESCSDTFASKEDLLEHRKVSHTIMKYKCDQCEKQFLQMAALRKHVKMIHENVQE